MNVKPGDLAIVVRTTADGHNLGKMVKVLRRRMPEDFPDFIYTGPGWVVESIGSPFVVVSNGYACGYESVRPFRDHCLRPISGLPDTESTDRADEAIRKLKKQSSDHVAGGSKNLIPEEAL